MKKSKVVIPALGLIALSTAASITGTVAWFTANNSVTVKGMTVKTQVGNNLLIADNTAAASFTDTAFKSNLTQSRSAKLEPVSTIDGLNFFYTTISNDDGKAKDTSPFYAYSEAAAQTDTDADKTAYDSTFNTKYVGATVTPGFAGTVVYGYVDYTFYLKASFTATGDKLVMDKCNLLYDNDVIGATDLAWRVAVFSHAAEATTTAGVTTVTTYTTAMADGDRKGILAPAGAEYQTKTGGSSSTVADAVSGLGATTREDGKEPAYADVKNLGTKPVIYTTTADSESNKVFKVIVRLWLEGEDTKCYVDNYKALTANYTLDLGFRTEKVAEDFAVNAIGSVA